MTQASNAPKIPTTPVIAGADAPAAPIPRTFTVQDIIALRARRSELSDQLSSAAGRRHSLVSELNGTGDEAARAGLETRIAVLDKRMVQLEGDIAQTGQLLSSDAASRVAATVPQTTILGMSPSVAVPLGVVFTIFVLGPLALGAARMMWKRSSRPIVPASTAQSAEHLARLEQSVDAIAVEVERISEGQRFVTKLLSEKAAMLPAVNEQLKDTTQYQVP
jgi:hypothetical protein